MMMSPDSRAGYFSYSKTIKPVHTKNDNFNHSIFGITFKFKCIFIADEQ